jgi:hypothetical protein
MDVSLGKRAEDGTRSWFRNSADMVVNKEQVVRELDAARKQLDYVIQVQVARDKARSVYEALEDFATSQDRQFGEVMRALTPGSDGIARLADGEVANFTRTGVVRGDGAFDRLGRRNQLADDVDAVDARMLGDMGGLPDDVQVWGGRPIKDVSPRIQGLSRQVDAIDVQIRRVEDEIADPSPNFFAETKLSPATDVSPEMDALARQMWDDPNFNAVSKEFFEQYKDLVSLRASIDEMANPSPERLRVLAKQRLEQYKRELFDLESEMERFGAGRNKKGQLRWFVDVGMRGFRRKNAKGGYGKGKVRGGEYDWFDSLSKGQQKFLSRNYFESSGAGRSATNRSGGAWRNPDDNVLAFNLQDATDMDLDEYWENVLRLIGMHASMKDGINKLTVAARKPRNADLADDRLDDLRNMLINESDSDYLYYVAMVDQIPYTEKQFREVYTRINELGEIGRAHV